MHVFVLMFMVLGCGAHHRAPSTQTAVTMPNTLHDPLLGTWRGAVASSPTKMVVFGATTQGLKAEVTVEHTHGTEIFTMYGLATGDGITFSHAEGSPSCHGVLDGTRLVGECRFAPGGDSRQWLVVQQ